MKWICHNNIQHSILMKHENNTSCRLFYWVLFFGLQECSRGKERKREKNWGDRKTCQKGELQLTYITTMVK